VARRNLFLSMALIGLSLVHSAPRHAAQPTAPAEPCKYRDQMVPVIQATSDLFTHIAVLSQKMIKRKVNHLIKVSVNAEFATNEIDSYQNDKPLAHRLSIPLGEAWTDAQTAVFARDSQKDPAGFSHYFSHGEASASRAWRMLGAVASSTPLIHGGVPIAISRSGNRPGGGLPPDREHWHRELGCRVLGARVQHDCVKLSGSPSAEGLWCSLPARAL